MLVLVSSSSLCANVGVLHYFNDQLMFINVHVAPKSVKHADLSFSVGKNTLIMTVSKGVFFVCFQAPFLQ